MSGTNPVDWAGQGLNFGNTLLNYGLSQMGSAADSKRAFKYWNRMRDRVVTEAYEAYQRQRADARKDTLQQYQLDVAAKKNAGLNPALGEGQGAVTMSQPNIDMQDNSAIQSQSGQVQNNPLLMAQLENIQADTLQKKTNAGLLGSQTALNKQIFDQNIQKFPIYMRLLGNEADQKEAAAQVGWATVNRIRKECDLIQEQITGNQITNRMLSVDEQVKGVRIYLEIRKALMEIAKMRSETAYNYASASNQRAQAWLVPYQARNLNSSTALNYAKRGTEFTLQKLNNASAAEVWERTRNWRLKNTYQEYENKIKGWKADLVDQGYDADAQPWQNVFNLFTTENYDARHGKVHGLYGITSRMFYILDDFFGTSIDNPGAQSLFRKGINKLEKSFSKGFSDIHRGLSNAWSWYSNGVQQGIRKSKEWKFNENNKLGFEYYK